MLIRPIVLWDVELLLPILRRCGAFSDEEVALALEVMNLSFTGDAYPHLVIERHGQVIGYLCVGPVAATRSTWHLYWIVVDPGELGTGAATTLLAAGEAWAREHGGERIVLETGGRPDYARQRRFYEKSGYREVGRVVDYYKPGDDCVYYCKTLGSRP